MAESPANTLADSTMGYLNNVEKIKLLNWRPFPGVFLPSSSTTRTLLKAAAEKEVEKNKRMGRSLDTSGLDTFLVIVRALSAFAWGFLDFESEEKEEMVLIRTAIGPLGVEPPPGVAEKQKAQGDDDREGKGKLLRLLYPECSLEEYQQNPKTFTELMHRLPRIILRNMEFRNCRIRLYLDEKPLVARRLPEGDGWDITWNEPGSPAQLALEKFINKLFEQNARRVASSVTSLTQHHGFL